MVQQWRWNGKFYNAWTRLNVNQSVDQFIAFKEIGLTACDSTTADVGIDARVRINLQEGVIIGNALPQGYDFSYSAIFGDHHVAI